ncbi:MAG: WG repeat-containing protein [Clostridia bacterium]|nr:WG repeat-containing protein [Clostridia bacterium]
MSENIIQYVAAASNGDTDAMAKLYSRTLKASYFLADTLCADSGISVAEITKKAYAKAFCTIDKLKKPEAFEIWMKQNVALVYKDTQKFVFGDAEAGTEENSSEFLSESVLEDKDSCEKILEAIAALKPVLRTAIVLHYNNGMPVQILAKFLGVSESTANSLLGKARAEILAFCGFEASTEPTKSLPVLTRIFQFKAVETEIENTDVRDIFIYAIDAYEASKPAVEAPAEPAPSAESAPEAAEEAAKEEAPVPAEEEKAEESASEDSNIISFKQKINEILDSEKIPAEEKVETPVSNNSNEIPEEIDVPVINVPDSIPAVSDETLDNFAPAEKSEEKSSEEKPKAKVNPKIVGIICAVLAVVIVILAFVAGGGESPDKESTTDPAVSHNVAVSAEGYKWVEGGFAECTELEYLDENCCYFKSATTGKYGLLDYQGNVILQPYYDGFERCSSGRDYSGRGSYHSLVKLGNETYEFTISAGVVTVSQTPHSAHSIDTESLTDVSYDERDRYFEGYAAAKKDDKWGYVSQENDKKVIKYEYEAVNELQLGSSAACDYCRPVTGGLIAVKKDGKMGIINLKNKVIVPFDYTNIMPGSNGVFIACKDGVWGVILVGDAVASFKGVNISVIEQQSTDSADSPDEGVLGKYEVVSDDGANIRSDAGADYDLVGELKNGDIVAGYATKEAENGNEWLCIKYKGEYAWVAMSNLESVN